MEWTENSAFARLVTPEQYEQLLENGRKGQFDSHDPMPVVKIFTPDAGATWLLSEIIPDQPELAFGLCDLGLGYPELGYIHLPEIMSLRGKLGLSVERDESFRPTKTLQAYAEQALRHGYINA